MSVVRDAHYQYSAQWKDICLLLADICLLANSSESAIFLPQWQLLLPVMINFWQDIRQTLFLGAKPTVMSIPMMTCVAIPQMH